MQETVEKYDELKDNKRSRNIFVIVVVFIVAFVIISSIGGSSSVDPSTVDVSAIAQLSEEQVGQIEEVLTQIYDSNLGWLSNIHESLDNSELVHWYSGGSWSSDDASSLSMSVDVYINEYFAINRMQSIKQLAQDPRFSWSYTYFVNDNNTEAILRYTFIERTGSYLDPRNHRRIDSYIRIGNVVIRFMEWQLPNEVNSFTDEFITLLVEMLQ